MVGKIVLNSFKIKVIWLIVLVNGDFFIVEEVRIIGINVIMFGFFYLDCFFFFIGKGFFIGYIVKISLGGYFDSYIF